MATNDEIIAEINNERRKQQIRGAMLMLPTDTRAENYKDIIKAMDKARADERARIKKIIQDYISEMGFESNGIIFPVIKDILAKIDVVN